MQEWKSAHDDGGQAASPPPGLASWYAQGLSDGLGDRLLMFDNSNAPSLELLRFRPDIAHDPRFENALRERVERLAQFRHPAFAPVRSVKRLEPDDDLALISNFTPGKRLSEVLHHARGPEFAATLIRQLAPALVLLQQQGAGISHGVLSPDRIVVSRGGRLTIVEHVVGPALETLNLPKARLESMGIALPPAAGDANPRLDVATDWYQLGLVAVSVLLGRPIAESELPHLESLLDGLAHSHRPDGPALPPLIRQWLDRTLQISGGRIGSGTDARAALDELLQQERSRDSRRLEALRSEPAAGGTVLVMPPASADAGEERSTPKAILAEAPSTVEAAEAPSAFVARAEREADARPADVLLLFDEESSAAETTRPATIESKSVYDWNRSSQSALEDAAAVARPDDADPPATRLLHREPVAAMAAPIVEQPPLSRPVLVDPPAATRSAVEEPPPVTVHGLHDPYAATRPRLHDAHVATRAPLHDKHLSIRHTSSDAAATGRPLRDPHEATRPRPRKLGRWSASSSMVAALLLIATAEAGVIGVLARTLWFRPQSPIAVETAASGENVLVSNGSTDAPPIKLAVAPDLRWVRVTAPADKASAARLMDAAAGTIRISSPIDLKIFEHARLVGSVPGDGLKLAAGSHNIELVNAALGYRLRQAVDVKAGETVSIHVAPPDGSVTIDASPWAEVTIDGRAAGRTPLGPLALTPGEHDVAFVHPAGGNDRQRVTVRPEAKLRVVGKLRR